jgi:hypothetical protein
MSTVSTLRERPTVATVRGSASALAARLAALVEPLVALEEEAFGALFAGEPEDGVPWARAAPGAGP